MTSLAERIRSERKAQDLGVNELDRLAGCSVGTTSRIEAGKRASRTGGYRATVAKLAVALKVRVEWLSDDEGPMREPVVETAPDSPIIRNHPRWAELVEEAKRVRPKYALTDADFERVAGSPILFGPLEDIDAELLAEFAKDVADWAVRTAAKK